MEKKIKGLQLYSSEIKSKPHARSIDAIEALAIKRGGSVLKKLNLYNIEKDMALKKFLYSKKEKYCIIIFKLNRYESS